jgi:hypothetical protein
MKKLIMAFAVLCAGCNMNSGSQDGEYMPLKAGNIWHYQLRDLGTNSLHLLGDTLVDGTLYFKARWGEGEDVLALRKDAQGNLEMLDRGPRRYYFDFRMKSGQTYAYPWCRNCDAIVVSVTRHPRFTASGKTYSDCVSYYFDVAIIADEEEDYTLCRDVGIVRIRAQVGDILLDSYTLR